jgi:glycosyltransferase involved in cell wall biosynthesis
MKRIFFISQVFYPDEVSTAGLFTGLCACIAENGYHVDVWSAQPTYTHTGRQPRKVLYHGINIRYLCSTRIHKSRFYGRVLNVLTFMISASLRLLFSRDKSPVFTHTSPPPLGIILSWICALRNRKLVYIMLDIYPEGLIRLGKMRRTSPVFRIWQGMFIRALRRSERILVLGRDMGAFIENICPGCRDKIDYIPHWQDEELIKPIAIQDHPFILEHGMEGRFIVQYSGNMGIWNDMETFGKAVNRNPDGVLFLFIGGGMRKKELLNSITSEWNNTRFLPFQPTEKLGEVLTACHVSLVSLGEGLEGMAVPSKIYGILAAGTPVIAMVPERSEIAYVVREEQCGYVLEPGDADGLVNAILELKSNETLRTAMGSNARKAFEEKYTTRCIAGKYMELNDNLG